MVPTYVCAQLFSRTQTFGQWIILDYRDHCQLFSQPSVLDVYFQLLRCSPGVTWLTAIAITHTVWISALCITILSQVSWQTFNVHAWNELHSAQIATGYTTNEKMNAWRYTHMKSNNASPFSLGCIQNLVDLIHRRVLWFTPVRIDWTHIYSLDDFNQSLLSQPRASMSSSPYRLLNVWYGLRTEESSHRTSRLLLVSFSFRVLLLYLVLTRKTKRIPNRSSCWSQTWITSTLNDR